MTARSGRIILNNPERVYTYSPHTFKISNNSGQNSEIPSNDLDKTYNFRFDFGTTRIASTGEEIRIQGQIPGIAEIAEDLQRLSNNFECDDTSPDAQIKKMDIKDCSSLPRKIQELQPDRFYQIFMTYFKGRGFGYGKSGEFSAVELKNTHASIWTFLANVKELFKVRQEWTGSKIGESYKRCQAICDILHGDLSPEDVAISEDSLGDHDIYRTCCDGAFSIRKEFLEIGGSEENIQGLIRGLNDSVQGYHMEGVAYGPSTYKEERLSEFPFSVVKNATTGFVPTLESLMILTGVKISEATRDTVTFEMIESLVSLYVTIVKDAVTLKKDVSEGQENNFLLVKDQKKSRGQAFKTAISELQKLHLDLQVTKDYVNTHHPEGEREYKDYIQCCEIYMITLFMWLGSVKKYGDVVFDIVLV